MKAALGDYHFLRLDADTLADPYPFFRRLRAEAPVFREPDYGVFLVSRFDDILRISRETQTFSSHVAVSGPFLPLPAPVDALAEFRRNSPAAERLLKNDPPDHTRYRSIVGGLFTPRRIAGLRVAIRALVDALIDGFAERGAVEFIGEFASVLPLRVVSELLGIPPEDRELLLRLFAENAAAAEGAFVGNPYSPLNGPAHYALLEEYFERAVAERKAAPRADILTELAQSRFPDGEEVPPHEIVKICVMLYSAGGDANTPQLLANGMMILAGDPRLSDRLREEPALVERFVEETLRFETSALGLFRIALQDTVVRDVPIRKGDILMMLYGSGNRDEQYFDAPDEFRMDRPKRRILSFGHGAHTCPGAPLARLQAEIAFDALLERLRDIRLRTRTSEYEYLPSVILRSLRRMELSFRGGAVEIDASAKAAHA